MVTAVLSLAAARAARGLPDLGPDRSFRIGDLVRVQHPDGSYAAGRVSGIRSNGEIAVRGLAGEVTAVPCDRLQPLPPLADGTAVRDRTSGRLGHAEGGTCSDLHLVRYSDGRAPRAEILHRVHLDPCAGPFGSDDGAALTPEPPEAA